MAIKRMRKGTRQLLIIVVLAGILVGCRTLIMELPAPAL